MNNKMLPDIYFNKNLIFYNIPYESKDIFKDDTSLIYSISNNMKNNKSLDKKNIYYGFDNKLKKWYIDTSIFKKEIININNKYKDYIYKL